MRAGDRSHTQAPARESSVTIDYGDQEGNLVRLTLIIVNPRVRAPAGLEVGDGTTVSREALRDIWIVAPETDQSGVSHSLVRSTSLAPREVTSKHFAVKGTPTDCVIMVGATVMVDNPPDLILSGVIGAERRRGCDVFRHDCGRDGGNDARRSVVCLSRPMVGDALQSYSGHGVQHGPESDPQSAGPVAFGRRGWSTSTSRLPAGGREGRVDHDAGQARSGPAAHRSASRRAPKPYYWLTFRAQERPNAARRHDLSAVRRNGFR